ncbi:hypothetical protein G7046_g5419 [Stylonectria norvegica]|nr:hypothetical protein G7046_g5419 [Stylonectria norvegica]
MDPDANFSVDEEENERFQDSPPKINHSRGGKALPELDFKDDASASDSIISGNESEASSSQSEDEDDDERVSLKRRAEHTLAPRPFKRHKGVLNNDYLDLLNRDIEDAAHRVCLADEADAGPSQLGLTFWSALEKKLFFEGLGRLGQDDLLGLASSIGTKSVIEVNHYIIILRRAQLVRQKAGLRPAIELAEYPAAIELSQQCCHALDEAADAVSVRQERKEEQREESKWGESWNFTPKIARMLDKGERPAEDRPLACAQVFKVHAWLKLSDRIFMNSSIPGENWHFIDENPPSMWATTFDDFYSLAVSVTRRLVQTTLFMAASRIKAKKDLVSKTGNIVKPRDVEAAIASLGLAPNAQEFWRKCAQRLRLDVYDEPPDRYEEGDEEALTYEEVEAALSDGQAVESTVEQPATIIDEPSSELPSDEDSIDESEFETSYSLSDEEELAINQEANEVLQYSAADFPETHRTKQSLKHRIATEHQQERYAKDVDRYASYQAETEMWDLLQKKPPMELPRLQEPGPLARSKLDVESIFPIGRDWRSKTKYQNEWETSEQPGR